MDWRDRVPACFGDQDLVFASDPTDEERAKKAIREAKAAGASRSLTPSLLGWWRRRQKSARHSSFNLSFTVRSGTARVRHRTMAEFASARSRHSCANPYAQAVGWAEPPIMEDKNWTASERSSPGLSFPYTRRFNSARSAILTAEPTADSTIARTVFSIAQASLVRFR